MTVQYEGMDVHKIIFGTKEVLLTESEIDEIQSWNFYQNVETKTVSDLEQMIDDTQSNVSDLTRELSENFEHLNKIINDDVFDEDNFNRRNDNIYKIIEKLKNQTY